MATYKKHDEEKVKEKLKAQIQQTMSQGAYKKKAFPHEPGGSS